MTWLMSHNNAIRQNLKPVHKAGRLSRWNSRDVGSGELVGQGRVVRRRHLELIHQPFTLGAHILALPDTGGDGAQAVMDEPSNWAWRHQSRRVILTGWIRTRASRARTGDVIAPGPRS